MILQSQNQFREDYIRPLYEGKNVDLPAGYAQKYAAWSQENQLLMPRFSPEDRTKAFAFELAKSTEKPQQILASKDGGQNFNQLLTREDLKNVNSSEYLIVSPTLREVLSEEVFDEQVLLHAEKNLTDCGYQVSNPTIFDGIISIDARTSNNQKYTVQIDPKQEADEPLNYNFIDERGSSETVVESQLPEKYKVHSGEKTIDPILAAGALMVEAMQDDADSRQNLYNSLSHNLQTDEPQSHSLQLSGTLQHNIDAKNNLERRKSEIGLSQDRQTKRNAEIEEQNQGKTKEKNKQVKNTATTQTAQGSNKRIWAGLGMGALGAAGVATPFAGAFFTTIFL